MSPFRQRPTYEPWREALVFPRRYPLDYAVLAGLPRVTNRKRLGETRRNQKRLAA
jgi:hypothetical protein